MADLGLRVINADGKLAARKAPKDLDGEWGKGGGGRAGGRPYGVCLGHSRLPTTECTAPSRAHASMAMRASGHMGM